MDEHLEKPFYKIGEVCSLTGTQPYVLRFWESEFPTLAPKKNRTGQRVYRKRDIDLIHRIKTLLYEEEYTIPGARKILESEDGEDGGVKAGRELERLRVAEDQVHASAPIASEDDSAPSAGRSQEGPYETEVKNLRAKLAHVENELRTILADMDRRDGR